MLNYIWFFLIIASIVYSAVTGNLASLSTAVMDGSKEAVELTVFLMGSMCAWLGFLRIAEKSGLTDLLSDALSPIIDKLFPEYKHDSEIKGKICMNISANLLGLGNAATPLGLSAISAMGKKNKSDKPTKGMILFVVINTASLQILPINIAAIRSSCGSEAPFSILPQVWITSFMSLIICITFCKIQERRKLWSI